MPCRWSWLTACCSLGLRRTLLGSSYLINDFAVTSLCLLRSAEGNECFKDSTEGLVGPTSARGEGCLSVVVCGIADCGL